MTKLEPSGGKRVERQSSEVLPADPSDMMATLAVADITRAPAHASQQPNRPKPVTCCVTFSCEIVHT